MLHNDASEAGFSHYGFFVLQNAGILLGFGIMLVIAMFEHKIKLSIEFWSLPSVNISVLFHTKT